MRKLIIFAVAFCILALSVFAQNANNTNNTNNQTNATNYNFSVTACNLCNNGTLDWGNLFVCDFNGANVACCNNMTLCNILYSNCTTISYIVPQVNNPGNNNNNNNNNGNNGNNNNNQNNLNPTSQSSSKSSIGGTRRAMRLIATGDVVGEPITISANNVFGPLSNVRFRVIRGDDVLKDFTADGEVQILLDDPGLYLVEASRVGYLESTAKLYLFDETEGVDSDESDTVIVEPVQEVVPEPVKPVEVVESTPVEYNRISGMSVTSPKKKLNLARTAVLLLAIAGIGLFMFRKFSTKPPKNESRQDQIWGEE